MLLNERLITRKQWGIRIGDLTVVTKWVFMRVSKQLIDDFVTF